MQSTDRPPLDEPRLEACMAGFHGILRGARAFVDYFQRGGQRRDAVENFARCVGILAESFEMLLPSLSDLAGGAVLTDDELGFLRELSTLHGRIARLTDTIRGWDPPARGTPEFLKLLSGIFDDTEAILQNVRRLVLRLINQQARAESN